jgi:hypothetical protein
VCGETVPSVKIPELKYGAIMKSMGPLEIINIIIL